MAKRRIIAGQTGSGKTQAGAYYLAKQNFNEKPAVIYDFKGDALLNSIEGVRELGVGAPIPDDPGLYITHPLPDQDDDLVSEQMQNIWARGNTIVYIDEGLVLGRRNKWFRALLTQGRSREVDMIILTQRPTFVDVFAFSEADYWNVFRLNFKDLQKVNEYIPVKQKLAEQGFDWRKYELPKYHCFFYDVSEHEFAELSPVPDRQAILNMFKVKMATIPNIRSL